MTLAELGYKPWPPISCIGAVARSFLQAKVLLLFFTYVDIHYMQIFLPFTTEVGKYVFLSVIYSLSQYRLLQRLAAKQ